MMMERYNDYKATSIQWLKEIPSHWEEKKISSLFRERRTKVSDKDYQPLSVSKIGITPQLETAVKTDNGDNRKLVLKGDFVVNSRSDRKGSCGVSALDGSVSLINIVLCPHKQINGSFFHYLARSNDYIEEYYRLGRGIVADLWTTRYSELKGMVIPLPPLSEQEKIVNYIVSKTSKIDEYIAEKEKEVQLLNELKEAEITKVVTQGLNPNVKMKDSGISWIGMIPEHWDIYILKRLIKERKAGSWGNEPKTSEIDCICLRIADFEYQNYRFQRKDDLTIRSYKEKDLEDRVLKQGDILIEKSGGGEKSPVGRAVLYDLSIENAMYANFMEKIIPKEVINSHYLIYLLATMYSKRAMWTYIKYTTGIQNLDLTSLLSNEKIPLPPLDEQRAIVAYINEKTTKIEYLITDLQAEIEHLKEYKQRLIADCVTGQVNVAGSESRGGLLTMPSQSNVTKSNVQNETI